MDSQRLFLAALNVLGGVAVLGSYAYGIATHTSPGEALWGGVPASLRPLYQASMLAAAVGYLLFTYQLIFVVKPEEAATFAGLGYAGFNLLYLLILIPSTLWMSLTFSYVAQPSALGWALLRGVLFAVAAGAIGMLIATARLSGVLHRGSLAVGVLGAALFALHTTVLDAIVWPIYFRR
jgi:hypothetical protein